VEVPALKGQEKPSMSIFQSFLSLFFLLSFALSVGCGGGRSYKAAQRGPANPSTYSTNHSPPSSGSGAPSSRSTAHAESAASYDGDSDSGYDAPQSDSIATQRRDRPGLGTRFGEHRQSTVSTKRFERASKSPFAQVALHYNNLAGIQEQSWFRGTTLRELRAQTRSGGISISLADGNGNLLRGGSGAGRTYVVGQDGQRYTMHVRNDTGGSYEMVSSVDGLDIVDGKPASYGKRGYILAPYSTLVIEGFRTSNHAVAAFRFGSVGESYAARTSGDRNVGVIGFAFFAERGSRWTTDEIRRRESANPFPGGYAEPPSVVR
jgi:hypothetical protein